MLLIVDVGVLGFSFKTLKENWYPHQSQLSVGFFAVFGIFFPSVTGVFAGGKICLMTRRFLF